jgi:acid phosphatase (class A)
MEIGKAVGMMVAMYFKRIYQRPRPSQVYPPLMPLLLNPPHASYPNAHALQSNLMSQLLAQNGVRRDMKEQLLALALRVGQNREIAGVHYPSDRQASKRMVPGIMKILKELRNKESAYKDVVEQATKEWKHLREEPAQATLYRRTR